MQQNLNKKPDSRPYSRKDTLLLVPLCTQIVPVSLWDMLTMHISSWSLYTPLARESSRRKKRTNLTSKKHEITCQAP